MDRSPSGAVVAGTRAFAVALLAPVAARVGARPRVAADVAQALALSPGAGGVAVVEFAGQEALPGIERLVKEGGGVRVVVAVPPEHATAEEILRSLGVEPVRWDGRTEPILSALDGAGVASPSPAPIPPAIAVVGPSITPLPSAPGGAPAAWPATAPGPVEATEALARSLAGALPDGAALGTVAAQVLAGLSALEREVLAGDPQPFDAAPVRAAAVMRLRVAAALASAPPPGAPIDGAALQGILGEIDGLLAEVKELLREAPVEARPGLEAVRNALVREAIQFSEAATGRGADGAPAATPAPPGPAPRREPARPPAAARPLPAGPPRTRRRPLALLVILALATTGAVGYHAWSFLSRPAPTPPPTYAGAPAGTYGVDRGASRLLMTLPGKRVDPAELERFGRLEAARGNVVRLVSPGTWLIERAPAVEARP
jgi:hypothetical protein